MTTPSVRLGDLLAEARLGAGELWPHITSADLGPAEGEGPLVTDIAFASDEVRPGALFACIPGLRSDGHDFAPEALGRGAVAFLCERPLDLGAAQVIVPSVREALGPVSAAFWSSPSAHLRVVGVTGTNGKTTTCALLASIFEAQGWATGVIGTLTGSRTTPEAPMLQRRLCELAGAGVQAVAMEVSSHSLVQHRVDGTVFAAGLFNNLSQDHLDYHHTMEDYFRAKVLLFTRCRPEVAVVNRADPWGARLVERLARGGTSTPRVVTFSPEDATDLEITWRSCRFTWRGERMELNLGGRFNIANALGAATTAAEMGAELGAVAVGLRSVPSVRGRFQPVDEGQPFSVLVDFAHTPAALSEVLAAARELVAGPGHDRHGAVVPETNLPERRPAEPGRVIVVFGAGGDRDTTKRPLMGRAATEQADIVIVTSDNPRNEKPSEIIEQIVMGTPGGAALVEEDRARAIAAAISMAQGGDVVLIAGKGHETGQDFGTHVEPFDDADVARRILRGQL